MGELLTILLKLFIALVIAGIVGYTLVSFALWELSINLWPIMARVITVLIVLGIYLDIQERMQYH